MRTQLDVPRVWGVAVMEVYVVGCLCPCVQVESVRVWR